MTDQRQIRRAAMVAALSLTTLLAACGGGGGAGGSAPAASTTSTTTSSTTSTGTLAAPQYPAGSQELAAFNQLNSMRQQCGFPAVRENTLLDTAANNHYTYMVDNQVTGHYEVSGNPGFTGVTPQNRATAVGYAYGAGEENAGLNSNVGGAVSVLGLASVPYHLADMFTPYSEVGLKYGTFIVGPSASSYVFEMMTGGGAAPQTFYNTPLTFPCQGTTGVDYESSGPENPEPTINGTVFNVSTPIGTPIALIGNVSDTVVLTSGSLTDPNNNQIALNLLDSANDSNHEMPAYAAAAFPTSALQANTTYVATLTGTINGNTFTRQFSFTTGAQGQF